MKAAAEAKSREQRAIRATTIFFWFFSYEKEKNEQSVSSTDESAFVKQIVFCHFFKKSSVKSGLSRNAHPSRHYCLRDGLQGSRSRPKGPFY
ncbi:hypothetical protein [Sulfurimonas sp. HSL3-7]|uniref:hypothetical protein n=1 Tax=Sulfonitrofixus jiaomeiensis TaxID=3131938 RepID=UPI0031F82AA4